MGDDNRTPEDDEKLKKLEQKLEELKLVTTPEFEIPCSSTYRPHLEESLRMMVLPAPVPFGAEEILRVVEYWWAGTRAEWVEGSMGRKVAQSVI